jgi:hypothetical protein
VPIGVREVLAEFRLKNLSAPAGGEKAVLRIEMRPPDALLRRVAFCSAGRCSPVEFEVNSDGEYLEQYAELADWIKRYVELQKEEIERVKRINKIGDKCAKLKTLVLPELAENRGVFPFPEDARDLFRKILADYEVGRIMGYSAAAVADALGYLEAAEAQIRQMLQ